MSSSPSTKDELAQYASLCRGAVLRLVFFKPVRCYSLDLVCSACCACASRPLSPYTQKKHAAEVLTKHFAGSRVRPLRVHHESRVRASVEVSSPSTLSIDSVSVDGSGASPAFRSAFRLAFSSRRSRLARSLRRFSNDGLGFARARSFRVLCLPSSRSCNSHALQDRHALDRFATLPS